jgi:hypothetical protein
MPAADRTGKLFCDSFGSLFKTSGSHDRDDEEARDHQ